MTEPLRQQRTVYYSGRVQGVGFRYTTRSIAGRYAVTGFVQNLDDGRVLVVAEGATDQIDSFLNEVSTTLGRYIRNSTVTTAPATNQLNDFTIER